MNLIIAAILGILAGVCVGYSGLIDRAKSTNRAWFLAAVLSLWLALIYQGAVSV